MQSTSSLFPHACLLIAGQCDGVAVRATKEMESSGLFIRVAVEAEEEGERFMAVKPWKGLLFRASSFLLFIRTEQKFAPFLAPPCVLLPIVLSFVSTLSIIQFFLTCQLLILLSHSS